LLFTALGPSNFSLEDEKKRKLAQEAALKFNRPELAYSSRVVPMNVMAVRYLAQRPRNEYGEAIPPDEKVVTALRPLLSSEDVLLRGAVIQTLLTLGQFDVIDAAVQFIDAKEQNATDENREQVFEQARAIANAIAFVRDPQYVSALGALLKHQDEVVRRSAIAALRYITEDLVPRGKPLDTLSKVTPLPFLLKALDNKDAAVRYQAVWALSRAAGKRDWYPDYGIPWDKSFDPQAEKQSVARWKQWWADTGQAEFEKN
jgi:hypothetical protein